MEKKFKSESLIVAGDSDQIAPLDSVRQLAQQLTNCDFVVMKNYGHVGILEEPLTTATVVRNWLKLH